MVRRSDIIEPEDADQWVGRRCPGRSVELTPAGVKVTDRLLVEAGCDAPAVGRFSDATATELFLGTDLDDFPQLWCEIEAWRQRRSARTPRTTAPFFRSSKAAMWPQSPTTVGGVLTGTAAT